MLAPGLRCVAWASLLCAVASGASPERSVTATRPALKKQVALESGLPATRLEQKADSTKAAVVTTQRRSATRPVLTMQAAREIGVPATHMVCDTKLDDVTKLGGGGAEVQEVATVKHEKVRLLCTLVTPHFSTYANRLPLGLKERLITVALPSAALSTVARRSLPAGLRS